MKFKGLYWLSFGMSIALIFASCKKDEIPDPVIPNEQEIITTLNMTLTPTSGGEAILLSFLDMDGDGSEPPVISVSDSLMSNTNYTASLVVLNETVSPADSINAEIFDEAEEHQFFFIIDGLDASHSYDDADADGNPIGLLGFLDTGVASEGTIRVLLRHEPDKNATGVADGDISNAGGETDIEVIFDVVIE